MRDNQLVRDQNPDPVALISDNHFYNKTYYEQIDPSRFASKINVPVYLGGAWQDEQTGGHFPDFLNKFTHSPAFFATISNGGHVESLANQTSFNRYADFLNLYVAHGVPNGRKYLVGPTLASSGHRHRGMTYVQGNDYIGMTYAQAKHLYSSQGHIRIMFESGDAKGEPAGAPAARFQKTFPRWPIPGRKVTRLYLHPGGGLSGNPVSAGAAQDQAALVLSRPDCAADHRLRPVAEQQHLGCPPDVRLEADPEGQGPGLDHLAAEAERRDHRQRLARRVGQDAGHGCRPRGDDHRRAAQRQGGLRAERVAARQPPRAWIKSRSLRDQPVHADLARDARDMPLSKYQKLRLEIFPFAQPFRKGDRIRITLDAPGNARPSWAFDTLDHGQKVTVATDQEHQSLLALNVVPGISVPKQAPACGSLRSQPCRTYRG